MTYKEKRIEDYESGSFKMSYAIRNMTSSMDINGCDQNDIHLHMQIHLGDTELLSTSAHLPAYYIASEGMEEAIDRKVVSMAHEMAIYIVKKFKIADIYKRHIKAFGTMKGE